MKGPLDNLVLATLCWHAAGVVAQRALATSGAEFAWYASGSIAFAILALSQVARAWAGWRSRDR